jgi:hypothetical protein
MDFEVSSPLQSAWPFSPFSDFLRESFATAIPSILMDWAGTEPV